MIQMIKKIVLNSIVYFGCPMAMVPANCEKNFATYLLGRLVLSVFENIIMQYENGLCAKQILLLFNPEGALSVWKTLHSPLPGYTIVIYLISIIKPLRKVFLGDHSYRDERCDTGWRQQQKTYGNGFLGLQISLDVKFENNIEDGGSTTL